MKKLITFSLFCVYLLLGCAQKKEDFIDLSGEWSFEQDPMDQGITEKWFSEELKDSIRLPGSMAENNKGDDVSLDYEWTGNFWNDEWFTDGKYAPYREPDNIKLSFWLTPEKVYYGPAWYQKEILIPDYWKDKHIRLFLERPHWETTVWIDEQAVGMKNTLGTPHVYDLDVENLKPGKHKLTIRVDNRVKEINVGLDAHSISDNTQTNWNGIVGDIRLIASPKSYLDKVKIIPDISNKSVNVKLKVINSSGESQKAKLAMTAVKLNGSFPDEKTMNHEIELEAGINEFEFNYPMGDKPALWDEFNPNTYQMDLKLITSSGTDIRQEDFGMREFKVDGKRFSVNDRPVFLRGTLECAIFPLTGYPPTKIDEWQRIFGIIKEHGLNHMRFHSWCPPKAAFQAADIEGVYLQVEASAWTDIGDGEPVDSWLYEEGESILDNYGNHPSFVMMAHGNEPGGENHKDYLIGFVDHFKNYDDTKVYTSGAGWPFIDNADYFNSPGPRIQHWNANLNSIINKSAPQTLFDYQKMVDNTSMPIVSHEMGQWCVFPNFKEVSKYTGVLKPKNFEIFQESLDKNRLGHLADSLLLASGKLQTLCYKADIEAALRTKDFGGFQLLDLHDFPGQGTALVGVLDAFWDEKGYVTPDEFKSFSGQTVPLARLDKRVFLNTDTLNAAIEIAHFGEASIQGVIPKWTLVNGKNNAIAEGTLNETDIEIGNGTQLGQLSIPLIEIENPVKLTLRISVENSTNSWDVWVYPAENPSLREDNIHVTKNLDNETLEFLTNGGKVLLSTVKGSVSPDFGGDIGLGFSSIFWNTSWTNGQKPHTLGLLCNPDHSLFEAFPTEYHSNWQWWDAMSNSEAIILDDFPEITPLVRVVDDWFYNRSLGLVFEVRVGKGKLLISGIDLHTDLENRIEAKQMLYSFKKYMFSDAFLPEVEIDIKTIQALYK
ncbi:MAG: beta-galactosidase [Mongoliibacter sp.]|uniref:sugar-binding domain-containing protein n=1 Tax=Mongoliibacter sp. TaxID=2022438 RepID=UPI0012EEFA7B|nr:sugar-binding domain-containing protein [Mongoliibacter sp.]TVP53351.1 MAG: beta-galactosidase [Mongoliibacter sp.]